jgi:hypothetical protein
MNGCSDGRNECGQRQSAKSRERRVRDTSGRSALRTSRLADHLNIDHPPRCGGCSHFPCIRCVPWAATPGAKGQAARVPGHQPDLLPKAGEQRARRAKLIDLLRDLGSRPAALLRALCAPALCQGRNAKPRGPSAFSFPKILDFPANPPLSPRPRLP